MTTINPSRREDLEAQLINAGCTIRGNTTTCPRPDHEDKSPSASILCAADGHWRVFCHRCGGNAIDAIDLAAASAGLSVADWLRQNRDPNTATASRPAPRATDRPANDYLVLADKSAVELYAKRDGTIERWYHYGPKASPALIIARILTPNGKKTFRQFTPLPNGKYAAKNLVERGRIPLYLADELGDRVLVVEGEKCADAAWAIGIPATTSAMGAGKGSYSDWSTMRDRTCYLWSDNDDTGHKHMAEVKTILEGVGAKVYVVNTDNLNLPPKGDVADLIERTTGDAEAKRNAVFTAMQSALSTSPTFELLRLLEAEASGAHSLVPWPWPMLTDASRSLLPGSVTLLCGEPGSAKSWMILQSIITWQTAGIPVAALELEERKSWHLKRGLAQLEGCPELLDSSWVRVHMEQSRACALRHDAAITRLGRGLFCESPVTYERAAQWIEERCAAGFRVLIVDPITLADPGADKWDADRKFMTRAKAAVEQAGASLVLVTHPRKSGGFKGGGSPMDDLAGGAVYQRAAASVLWLSPTPCDHSEVVRDIHGAATVQPVHKLVKVLKARNSAHVGTVVAFQFRHLALDELGTVEKPSEQRQGQRFKPRGDRFRRNPSNDEDHFNKSGRDRATGAEA